MSSDSDTSMSIPKDHVLEGALRNVVKEARKATTSEDLTVNKAREAAEQKLGLSEGFFKTGHWKARSKEIINKAFQV